MAKPRRSGMRRSHMKRWSQNNTKPKSYGTSRPMMNHLNYAGHARMGMDILAFMGVDLDTIPNEPRERALQRAEELATWCDNNFLRNHVVLIKKKYTQLFMIWGNKGGEARLIEHQTHGLIRISIKYRTTSRAQEVAMQGKVMWKESFMINP